MRLARASFVGSVAALVSGTIAASQAPETHRFTPTAFYTTYSFAPRAARRSKPRARVITKTIDAAGVDWNNKTVSPGGNPQTGPFYVEGAEPEDILVVTIERIEPNRARGSRGVWLAPYAA